MVPISNSSVALVRAACLNSNSPVAFSSAVEHRWTTDQPERHWTTSSARSRNPDSARNFSVPVDDGTVLRADVFRPDTTEPVPRHHDPGSLRKGSAVRGRLRAPVELAGHGPSRHPPRLDPRVPGVGNRGSGNLGAVALRRRPGRLARGGPISRTAGHHVAAGNPRLLRRHRMGRVPRTTNQSPSEPGQVYRVEVEIWPTCIVLPAGYRLGLQIGGHDFEREPPDDPNEAWISRGSGPWLHTHPEDRPSPVFSGRTTIHTGGDTASSLLLPVIPPRVGNPARTSA
nr:CocE/NonD family hydrolase C-terminal non-catalytic domain-containing protein [Streptomyces rhizosphaericus]